MLFLGLKRMDVDENKIDLKSKSVDKSFDSGDDQPIGSLLKQKGKRKFKKIKMVPDGMLQKDKCVDNMASENEFGGMDDTLANFRKKLRAPKKNGGCQLVLGEHLRDNFSVSLSQSSEPLKNIKLDSDVTLEKQEKGCREIDGGVPSENGTIIKDLKVKAKREHKRPKLGSGEYNAVRDSEFHEQVSENYKFHTGKDTSEAGDDTTEDSTSTLFQKVQSGMIRKSRDLSRLQNAKKPQQLDVESKPNSNAGSEALIMKMRSASRSLKRFPVSDDRLHFISGQDSLKSSLIGGPTGENMQENSVCNAVKQGTSISPSDDIKRSASGILEDSSSISLVGRCHSSFRQCAHEISCVCVGEINTEAAGGLLGLSNEPPCSNNCLDRSCGNHLEADNNCLLSLSELSMRSIENSQDHQHNSVSNFCTMSAVIPCIKKKNCSSYGEVPKLCIEDKLLTNICNDSSQPSPKPSYRLPECESPLNHDRSSSSEEVNGIAYSFAMLDHQGSCPEETGSLSNTNSKHNNTSVAQRAARNAKKCRHEDMAYEGDVDWEVLMQGQEFLVDNGVVDKGREKTYSSMRVDAENGKFAAVTAGLKARAVCPIEKIKFKEVLKRKGGLQEYLECRNHILSVWNKDVSSILALGDFGVSDTSLVDESFHTSLVRDIFMFLDQYGYINFGVLSAKEKLEDIMKDEMKLTSEEKFEETPRPPVTGTEDADAKVLSSEKSAGEYKVEDNIVTSNSLESSALCDYEECLPMCSKEIVDLNPVFQKENIEYLGSLSSCINDEGQPLPTLQLEALPSGEPVPAVNLYPLDVNSIILSGSNVYEYGDVQSDSRPRKSIIIVGAGPAGLAAARHLQKQGFEVLVLEARSRIGGRIFTDRTSLSVPVDLGASIITGVEADVATERRPDPSSLICTQLGLELTVLNSDCPLYDIVTCQKVPEDLDKTLEAEYNSLLDDMVLLVAEKGEDAMKMSLEEGLEYGLERLCVSCSRQDDIYAATVKLPEAVMLTEESGLENAVFNAGDSKTERLKPLERRVMDWHFAHLEYGCAALLQDVSLPNWNQDDLYGGFGGAHCMIKGGYSAVVESLGEGLCIYLDHAVTEISYDMKCCETSKHLRNKVKISTSNGKEFSGDAVLVTVPLGCLKAETIKFFPALPQWKYLSIKRLGFGILNKVVLEFPNVFWDDAVDYFGATAESTDQRGRCFMFWNVKKTVGAPVLIALVVGMAAIEDQNLSSSENVNYSLLVLRKLFGEAKVPDPVASVVTDWGRDPYSYGAYSYVAVGSSGEDYDILGKPVENCLFFAGEATCKEHPDTVGGAMMSGLREAVRIMDILNTGTDYTVEVEAMEAVRRNLVFEKSEIKEIMDRLETLELSSGLSKNYLDGSRLSVRGSMLRDMFFTARTSAGRLHLAKELLNFPVGVLKTFASTKEGLSVLNLWILDSLGKDGTQLLRQCVRLLVLVSTDLLAVRLSGIGKTVKEKVCVHTSRDIRAIASQLVSVWVELFRKEKASKGGLLRLSTTLDSKSKSSVLSGKPPLHMTHVAPDSKGSSKVSASTGQVQSSAGNKRAKSVKLDAQIDRKGNMEPSNSHGSVGFRNVTEEENLEIHLSEEEKAAIAAAETAHAAAVAAAKAYASYDVMHIPELPKILSFHKFAMREQNTLMDESDSRKNWSAAALGKQDCLSEIDSRNCRVRDWSVDFSAAGVNMENSVMSVDKTSHRSHSNYISNQVNFREHSGESTAVDNGIFTKAWVDSAGSVGIKDYNAIDRWQIQAAAASSGFSRGTMPLTDDEDSNVSSKSQRKHLVPANESSASHITLNKASKSIQLRGAEGLKQAVVDYVASLLMPLYKARKIDKEGYKSIMKKTATKVMEQITDSEKAMVVFEFLDFKRKNKIRDFVDKLIERHMASKLNVKSGSSEKV